MFGSFNSNSTDVMAVLKMLFDERNDQYKLPLQVFLSDGKISNKVWNQDGLFVAVYIQQNRPDFKSKTMIEVWFVSLCIEDKYFMQSLTETFRGDVDVLDLNSDDGEMTFCHVGDLKEEDIKDFLEKKSRMLLETLAKHPRWGEPDGPNARAEHELLE